jgi:hypothetical protein
MARRKYAEWPEKQFCDDENSFFKCQYWNKFGERSIGRMIRNDGELVQELKKWALNAVNSIGVDIEFRDVDYNKLTFEEQIVNDLETDIMVIYCIYIVLLVPI